MFVKKIIGLSSSPSLNSLPRLEFTHFHFNGEGVVPVPFWYQEKRNYRNNEVMTLVLSPSPELLNPVEAHGRGSAG